MCKLPFDLRNCAGSLSCDWYFVRKRRFTVDLTRVVKSWAGDFPPPPRFFPAVDSSPNSQRYSMIFALKAYIGERSLRDQFKARHAINDCKAVSQRTPGSKVVMALTVVFLCFKHQRYGFGMFWGFNII